MESIQQPSVLAMPFANNGIKNTIPSSPTGTNKASLSEGFPLITSTSITEGGIPPERADFNALGNIATMFYYFMQCGGAYTFRADVSSTIGGYPKGALLWYIPATGIPNLLASTINNNTNNFNTDPSVIGEVGSGKPWEIVTVSPTNFMDLVSNQTANGVKTFASSPLVPTVSVSDDSTKSASTGYVKDCVPKSKGSDIKPVYTNSNGVITASNGTVGSVSQPIYLNSGTITACTTDTVHVVVDTYQNGSSWYRVYDDGWVEQGGNVSYSSTGESTVNLIVPYLGTYYAFKNYNSSSETTLADREGSCYNRTSTSFKTYNYIDDASLFQWFAMGYGDLTNV